MAITDIKAWVKQSPRGKQLAHRAIFPRDDYRPRWWVRNLLNRFVHSRKGTIRGTARMDTVPFHAFVLAPKAIIEDNCLVNNVMGDVLIGHASLIGLGSVIIGPAHIGDDVLLAQNVVLSALNHNYEDISRPIKDQGVYVSPIVVGPGSWLGAGAVVLAGVTVGRNVVVAAGAVVTKDVPDFCVVVGNPARVVRRYDAASSKYVRWRAEDTST